MQRPILIVLVIDVIAIAAAVMIYVLTGETKLGEGDFLTHLSGAQLLGISVISLLIFRVRNRAVQNVFTLNNSRILWGLIAAGFLFLMADELFKIHESIDHGIHSVFGIKETGVTDRIDDLLILLYALIGIGVITAYRNEFVIMKKASAYFLCGFGLLFLMVGLDLLTNRDDILRSFFRPDLAMALQTWLSFAEEGAKVLSEGFFLAAFYTGLRVAEGDSFARAEIAVTRA